MNLVATRLWSGVSNRTLISTSTYLLSFFFRRGMFYLHLLSYSAFSMSTLLVVYVVDTGPKGSKPHLIVIGIML